MSKLRVLDIKNGKVKIDSSQVNRLSEFSWYLMQNGYAGAMIGLQGDRKCTLMHRLLTDAPVGTCVDHINGDKLDNRLSNLRVTDQHINQINRKSLNKNNTSGTRGVTWRAEKGKWVAQISVYGANKYLGIFSDIEDAIAARKQAEVELWPEVSPCKS